MIEILIRLCRLIADALSGRASEGEVAKALIDAAFESGVPAGLLMEHLTARGKADAEFAADLAEWAKLSVKRVEKEIAGEKFTELDDPGELPEAPETD